MVKGKFNLYNYYNKQRKTFYENGKFIYTIS